MVDARVPLLPASARAVGAPVTGQIADNLWLSWFEIAMAQEATAARAREAAKANPQAVGKAVHEEFAASLVVVTACAFALEAFANHVVELLGVSVRQSVAIRRKKEFNGGRIPAAIRTLDAIAAGFDVGRHQPRWQAQLPKLFAMRNDVVHHHPEWRETVPHPNGLTHVSPSTAIYCLETATAFVDLVDEMLTTCISSPRRSERVAADWTNSAGHISEYIRERRGQPRIGT